MSSESCGECSADVTNEETHYLCAACWAKRHPNAGMTEMTELDVDNVVDERGIRYIGLATKRPNGQWVCLADVEGCLCLVEVKIRLIAKALPAT